MRRENQDSAGICRPNVALKQSCSYRPRYSSSPNIPEPWFRATEGRLRENWGRRVSQISDFGPNLGSNLTFNLRSLRLKLGALFMKHPRRRLSTQFHKLGVAYHKRGDADLRCELAKVGDEVGHQVGTQVGCLRAKRSNLP